MKSEKLSEKKKLIFSSISHEIAWYMPIAIYYHLEDREIFIKFSTFIEASEFPFTNSMTTYYTQTVYFFSDESCKNVFKLEMNINKASSSWR